MAADLSMVNAVVLIQVIAPEIFLSCHFWSASILTKFFLYRFLQAHVRSFLARKKMLKVRKEYEEVFEELEKSAKFVLWKKEGFGLPLISSRPKVLNDVNEKTKLASRENGDERCTSRSRGRIKKAFCNGELLSDADVSQDGFSSDTEKYSLGNRNFNVAGLHREKVDEEIILDYEDPMLERTAISERYDEDLQQNHGFLADNGTKSSEGQKQKEEKTFPEEKSQQKLTSLRLTAEMTNCDCGDDKCPHKLSNPPCSSLPLSSTPRDTPIDEQEIKETAGHDSKYDMSLQGSVHKRLHLRDQAILSDSWLTDRSFGKQLMDTQSSPVGAPLYVLTNCQLV